MLGEYEGAHMVMTFLRRLLRVGIFVLWCLVLLSVIYAVTRLKFSYTQDKIVVFTWGDMFHPDVIKQFEQETGIRVIVSAFSSNEEMLAKLRTTQGRGFDVIICSDYAVRLLIEEKLVRTLSSPKAAESRVVLSNFLRYLPYDPREEYSLPLEWEIFGIGYDARVTWPQQIQQWRDIFSLQPDQKIIMVNDALEALWFAAHALHFRDINSDEQWHAIEQLLHQQKTSVMAYTDNRADYYLVTHNCPCAVASSSYIWRAQKEYAHLRFLIPQGPSFVTIENMLISKECRNEDAAYRFMQFLLRVDVQRFHAEVFNFLPAHDLLLQEIIPSYAEYAQLQKLINGTTELLFFKPVSPWHTTQLWMNIKST